MKNIDLKNETPTFGNVLLADVVSITKLRFSEDFKKLINELPIQDWLWYIQNDEFEVKEVVDGKISIKGLHCLGFRTPWHFNIC
jgi:hypothetical protein